MLRLGGFRSGLNVLTLRLGGPGMCHACEQTQYADNNQQSYQIHKHTVEALCSSFFQLNTLPKIEY